MKRFIAGTMAGAFAMTLMTLFMTLFMTGCSSNKSGAASDNPAYKIVVDEDTLVQYIQWSETGFEYDDTDSHHAGLTVRVKADGTPCTIAREDLDKYEHFSFGGTDGRKEGEDNG